MKLVFVLSSLALSGGVRVVIEYANRLAERGYQIVLLAPGGTLAREFSDVISAKIEIIETRTLLSETRTVFGKLKLLIELILRVPRADAILATHTPTTTVSLFAGTFLKKAIPIWFYQDYPGMFEGRPFESFLLRHAINWHRGALTISDFSKNELERLNPKCRVFLVGEGLSCTEALKPLSIEEREKIKPAVPTIFYLGDMRPRKGMQDFLEAIGQVRKVLPSVHVWIASKELCEVNTSISYTFFKRPDEELLARLYGSCDVFVSASWWEGFGLPPLEAMACGAPVVTTDSQGVREFARDGENCLMVPTRNPEAMATAILRLINDSQLAQRLRENGPKTAALFKWDTAVDRFEVAINHLSLI